MIGPSRDHHTNEHQLTLPLWCFFGDERSPSRGLRVKSEAAPDTATKRSLFFEHLLVNDALLPPLRARGGVGIPAQRPDNGPPIFRMSDVPIPNDLTGAVASLKNIPTEPITTLKTVAW
jgi:hypothetical protein